MQCKRKALHFAVLYSCWFSTVLKCNRIFYFLNHLKIKYTPGKSTSQPGLVDDDFH